MQRATEELRGQLWDKLKVVYNKYAGNGGEIAITRVEEIVRDVLGEQTQQEIDYVIKNMFRLDADGSGTVDFLQFGNFLFKRHCGQMSLQNLHRNNKISRGSDRLINSKELFTLLNNAYSFLKVSVSQDGNEHIFKDTDKDRDGYITYVQYFQFIDKFICQTRQQFSEWSKTPVTKKEPVPVVDTDRLWNGRLRLFLWGQLQKLYEAFIKARVLSVNDENLRGLIFSIMGELSQLEVTFLLNGLFKLEQKNIEFIPFAIIFFYLVAELGLSRYQRNHNSDKKTINVDEFILIFRNSFKFLSVDRVRNELLQLIFAKIDTNRDRLITIAEYLEWVKRYLAVSQNKGEQFYLREDDSSLQGEDFFNNSVIAEVKEEKKTPSVRIVFKFSNYDLSNQVRKRVYELLVPFDKNFDKKFDEREIHDALITLLKEDEHELYYMTKNVFRYDYDNDKLVTYDELTNFCVEWHFGEMAIQRLHRKNSYSRGKERIMNENEFGFTLNHALGFIGMNASAQQIRTLFSQINLEKNGWITYEIYFLFLKHYFGTLRHSGDIVPTVDPDADWLNSLSGLSPLDRFIRLLLDQLRRIFLKYDYNKNLLFEEDEIEAILHHVFGLNETEVSYIILRFFNFAKRQNKSLQFDELVKILLEVYFIEIVIKRKYKDTNAEQWKNKRISLIEFIELVTFACFFLRVKPTKEDLSVIFRIIDTDNDGYISFSQYAEFIRKYLGLNIQIQDEVKPLPNPDNTGKPSYISNQEWQFINAIWSELRVYFNKYDTGSKGYLTEQDLKRFVIEVLNENTTRELEYIFWNLFRVDPNGDRSVEFHEFAPFILSHAGEIALQRFHREQTKGKSNLTENELFIVFSNAFSFLSTMSKSRNIVNIIYKRIGNNSTPSYGAYLGWVNRALASKFRQ